MPLALAQLSRLECMHARPRLPHRKEHNGGALRLTPPSGPVVDVYPHAGRLAMFMSKTGGPLGRALLGPVLCGTLAPAWVPCCAARWLARASDFMGCCL